MSSRRMAAGSRLLAGGTTSQNRLLPSACRLLLTLWLTLWPRGRGRLSLVAVRDGAAAADADGVARDDERRRELPALELVGRRLDAVEDVVDERAVVPLVDDLLGRILPLEVEPQDRVERVVGRKALVVELVGRKLRRRALVDDGGGDQFAPAVDVAREVVDLRLQHV